MFRQEFYKDKDNSVICIELKKDWVRITKEEADFISNPPKSALELNQQKEHDNTSFLSFEMHRVKSAIELLEDAISFEEATDEEIAQHKELRKYRLMLSRVQNQQEWPLNPVWPECPEFFKHKE